MTREGICEKIADLTEAFFEDPSLPLTPAQRRDVPVRKANRKKPNKKWNFDQCAPEAVDYLWKGDELLRSLEQSSGELSTLVKAKILQIETETETLLAGEEN